MQTDNTIVIFGIGGFGREVYNYIKYDYPSSTILYMVDDEYFVNQKDTIKFSDFDVDKHHMLICVGDPVKRSKIVNKFPSNTKWYTYIHSSIPLYDGINIGVGSILCPGTILTTNINIGKHCHLNLLTTVGHDTVIGDFFTTAPGVKISGNCTIGDRVYFGTNACVREKITICDDVTIGLNGGVVKGVSEPGTYVGTPAKLIKFD